MFLPHLFSLSNELLIEIISNLCPVDIYACRCTCRRLNGVIINSHLIQYIMRTALSGVFDPLEPGLSLPDRLDALERWETSWMEMDLREPNVIVGPPVSAENIPVRGPGLLSGQYFIVYSETIGASAFYSFLDMHATSLHTSATRWTTIEIDAPVPTFAFAPELDLAIAISTPALADHPKTTVMLSSLQFGTGKPHPLASQPKLEFSIFGSAAHNLSYATVIGDYVLYWVGELHGTVGSLCGIYLIAWKEGWVSELRTSLSGVYCSTLSILSEEIILLIRRREPALELCRLSNIGDPEMASLEVVRILSLPVLTSSTSLCWVAAFDEHPGHALFSKNHQQHPSPHHPLSSSSSGLSAQKPEDRADTRRHLHSVPMDGIVVVLMQFVRFLGTACMFDLTARCRTLLEFSNVQAQTGAAGTSTVTGAGKDLTVPWEKWSPNKAHFLEHDSFVYGGSLVGERRATLLLTSITIRDYNPFRVQRALKLLGGADKEVTLECGSVVKVVKEKLVYRGGDCFRDDIETSLPYVKTVSPYDCDHIITDKDNIVAMRTRMTQDGEPKVYYCVHWVSI